MRVDVTKRPVGSFFGGKRSAANSVACPTCTKPALLIKTSIKNGKRVRHYAHGFKLVLNSKNDPEVEWDSPCVEAAS